MIYKEANILLFILYSDFFENRIVLDSNFTYSYSTFNVVKSPIEGRTNLFPLWRRMHFLCILLEISMINFQWLGVLSTDLFGSADPQYFNWIRCDLLRRRISKALVHVFSGLPLSLLTETSIGLICEMLLQFTVILLAYQYKNELIQVYMYGMMSSVTYACLT